MRESLASKLKTARPMTGLSTRAVAAGLASEFPISHATIANYEAGRSVPPLDVLASLAGRLRSSTQLVPGSWKEPDRGSIP